MSNINAFAFGSLLSSLNHNIIPVTSCQIITRNKRINNNKTVHLKFSHTQLGSSQIFSDTPNISPPNYHTILASLLYRQNVKSLNVLGLTRLRIFLPTIIRIRILTLPSVACVLHCSRIDYAVSCALQFAIVT